MLSEADVRGDAHPEPAWSQVALRRHPSAVIGIDAKPWARSAGLGLKGPCILVCFVLSFGVALSCAGSESSDGGDATGDSQLTDSDLEVAGAEGPEALETQVEGDAGIEELAGDTIEIVDSTEAAETLLDAASEHVAEIVPDADAGGAELTELPPPCEEGPCCPEDVYRSTENICKTSVEVECIGVCGGEARTRPVTRYCSGVGSYCDGEIVLGDWVGVDCGSEQLCKVHPNAKEVSCLDCDYGCQDGACNPPVCEDGPCCGGAGQFLDPSHECETLFARRCAGGMCGGAVQERFERRYCDGEHAQCEGPLQPDPWTTVRQCESGWLCDDAAATCRHCPAGCDADGCVPCTWTWEALSLLGEPPMATVHHAAVWAPEEASMFVGGGLPEHSAAVHRFDPNADSWTAVSACEVGDRPGFAWTGAALLSWAGGGISLALDGSDCASIGADAGEDVLSLDVGHSVIQAGDEMIVWGGGDPVSNLGARYDPGTGAWSPTSLAAPVPTARAGHVAAWTGNEMIVWGGGAETPTNTGARYEPSTDSWAATSVEGPCPVGRLGGGGVWTGTGMAVWGGEGTAGALGDGAVYDPGTDSWAAIPVANAPAERFGHTMVWTGSELIVWGGGRYEESALLEFGDGAHYDPASGTWTPMPTAGAPAARAYHTAVWTGYGMILWGGGIEDGLMPGVPANFADGARYRCKAD